MTILVVIGIIIGVLTGCLVGISPSLGLLAVVLIGSLIGGVAAQVATVVGVAVYLIISVCKESLTPHLSGNNELASVISAEFAALSPRGFAQQIISKKLLFAGLGLGLGCLLPALGSSMLLTWVAAGCIVLMLPTKEKVIGLMYLAFIQLMFVLCIWWGVAFPVLAIGQCIFSIPSAIKFKKLIAREEGSQSIKVPADIIKVSAGGLLSFFSPGISSYAALNIGGKSGLVSMLSTMAAGAFAEAYTVGLLATGASSGKTLLGIELSSHDLNSQLLICLFVGGLLIGSFLFPSMYRKYLEIIQNYKFIYCLSLFSSVALCVISCGLLSAILIPFGIWLDWWLTKNNVNPSIRSLMFLGPLLIG
jgi:hypothetical protein